MKKNIFLQVCLLVILISCSNTEEINLDETSSALKTIKLSGEEYASISNDNPTELSESEIYTLINNFAPLSKSKLKYSRNSSLNIQGKYYVSLDKKDKDTKHTKSAIIQENQLYIPIYEVHVEEQNNIGIAYVCADSRFADVIAYIPENNEENKESQIAKSMMLDISEMAALQSVVYIENLKDSLREQTLEKIAKGLSLNQDSLEFEYIKSQLYVEDNSLITKSAPVSYPDGRYPIYSGMQTLAQWGQHEPYNRNLPNLTLLPDLHYPAGCGVIAIATLYTCVRPNLTISGTTIDWNYLLENESILEPPLTYWDGTLESQRKLDMVGKLIKDIYYGTETNTNFEGDKYFGSSETLPSKIQTYLQKYINIGNIEQMNIEKIYKALFLYNQPSLMGGYRDGGAHGWVVDECVTVTDKNATGSVRPTYLYIHCNMGWEGASNGYYLVSSSYTLTFDTHLGSYNRDIWQLCGGSKK